MTAIQYNTRSLRRIVQLGVRPEPSAVWHALSTFLPLADYQTRHDATVLDDLLEQLVVNGVDRDAATISIADFRASLGEQPEAADDDE
jgi:hypothetical protein